MTTKLKELRVKNKYTQEQMANLLGLKHKSHYCQIEKGEIKPSLEIALRISKVFGESIENIFFN